MNMYYKITAILSKNEDGTVRKLIVEMMPHYMQSTEALFNEKGDKLNTYHKKCLKEYDSQVANLSLTYIFKIAKDIEIIRFFRYVPEDNRLEQLESRLF